MNPGQNLPVWLVIIMIATAWAVCAALVAFVSLVIVGLWIPLQAWEQPKAQATIAARFQDRVMRFGPFRGFLGFYLQIVLLLIPAKVFFLLIRLLPWLLIRIFWENDARKANTGIVSRASGTQGEGTFSFALCPECLGKYRSLAQDPSCQYVLNSIPFCSLEWPDEHPKDGVVFGAAENHEECKASILRMVAARTHLWRTGYVPDELGNLWGQAQQAIPNWPGFKRLSLDRLDKASLDACAEELQDLLGHVTQDFPQIAVTHEAGFVTFTARRKEQEVPGKRPWWQFWRRGDNA